MEIKNLPKREKIKKEYGIDSPIEIKLLYWFTQYGLFPQFQYEIGKYRADFAFEDIKLVIECDGKEWHSTEEQEKYDKERDKYMKNLGWKVMRFSGTEIHNEPWNICKKVYEVYYPRNTKNNFIETDMTDEEFKRYYEHKKLGLGVYL